MINKYSSVVLFFEKILKLQKYIYECDKNSISSQLRHGRIGDKIYINGQIINSTYGHTKFIPNVKLHLDNINHMISITIIDNNDNTFIKRFVIKQSENNYEFCKAENKLSLEGLLEELKLILNENKDTTLVDLVLFIKGYSGRESDYKNIQYYEYG